MNGYTFIRLAKRLGYSQQTIKTILINNNLSCEYLDINSEPIANDNEMLNYYTKDGHKEFAKWL